MWSLSVAIMSNEQALCICDDAWECIQVNNLFDHIVDSQDINGCHNLVMSALLWLRQ